MAPGRPPVKATMQTGGKRAKKRKLRGANAACLRNPEDHDGRAMAASYMTTSGGGEAAGFDCGDRLGLIQILRIARAV